MTPDTKRLPKTIQTSHVRQPPTVGNRDQVKVRYLGHDRVSYWAPNKMSSRSQDRVRNLGKHVPMQLLRRP